MFGVGVISVLVLALCQLSQFTHAVTFNGDEIFFVQQLTTNKNITYDLKSITGDYISGQLAFTSDGLVVSGSRGAYLLSTNDDSASPVLVSDDPDMFFISDLRSKNLVAFLGEDGLILNGPGYLTYLSVFSASSPSTTTTVELTSPIFIGLSSAVFAGYGRFVLADGGDRMLYDIDINTGEVVSLGASANSRWQQTDGWIAIGVAEFFTFTDTHLLYANQFGQIEQQNIGDGSNAIEVVYHGDAFDSLSAIAASPETKRWAFSAIGSTPFLTTTDASAGVAAATFIEAWPTSQPSTQPSTQPSLQPTSMPSLHPDAPKILNLVLRESSVSIAVNVTLDMNSVFAGTVYCAAFLKDTSVSSTSQILASGSSATYAQFVTTVSLTLLNLIPATTYDVYCYAVTQQGYANSLQDVLNTKKSTHTTCCKTTSFTNSPSSVFSDTSKYTASSSRNDFTFVYSLSHLPSRNVTLTPTFLNATTGVLLPNTTIRASPASKTFLSTTSKSALTDSFVVLASSKSFSANVRISLVVSGPSSSEFTPTVLTTFTMLSTFDPPPAPVLETSLFSNQGSSIYLIFDTPTDLAEKSVSKFWSCMDIFKFPGANYTNCIWLNSTHVEGVFQSGVSESLLPSVGAQVMLKSYVVKAQCSSSSDCALYSFSAEQNVTLSPPVSALSPTVVLSMPTALGGCDNLAVIPSLSTGHAGRNWTKMEWSVTTIGISGNGVSTSSFVNYLYSKTVSPLKSIAVPRELLSNVRYSITLTLTNFLGTSGSATSIIDISSDAYKPRLSILGSTNVAITSNKPLSISSRGQYSQCTPMNSTTLLYTWSMKNSNGEELANLPRTGTDPSVFSLPSYSLSTGEVYTTIVNCSAVQNGIILGMSTASAQVTVVKGAIYALVTGGSNRRLPIDANMTIDASASYDEDVSGNNHLTFLWSCIISTLGENYGEDCTSVLLHPSSTTTFRTATVVGSRLNTSLAYSVIVIVAAADGRSGSETVNIIPDIAGSPYTELLVSTSVKFNSDQNLSLSGLIQSKFDSVVAWSVTVSGLNVSANSFAPLLRTYPSTLTVDFLVSAILLAANTFQAGTYVTFRLTATSTITEETTRRRLIGTGAESFNPMDTTTVVSYSEIILIANVPPVGGTLALSPPSGSALSDLFTLQSPGWIDDPADYPLAYDFRSSSNPRNQILTVQSKGPLNVATSDFPPGIQAYNNQIFIFARIYDIYNAFANANGSIVVVVNPNADVSSYLNNGLSVALNAGNVDEGLRTVNNVASTVNIVNCTGSSNAQCAGFHREPCTNIPNTCGPCLSGYIGTSGPANSACLLADSLTGNIGDHCLSNNDCILGLCGGNSTCVAPIKNCPNDSGAICSGHGQCTYLDLSGNLLEASECVETNVFCKAVCVCHSGFSGFSCSLSPSLAALRDSNRGLMCSGLNSLSSIGDDSSSLLESLSGSLSAAYSASEVSSSSATNTCRDSLGIISNLAQQGFVSSASTADSNTQTYLFRSVSAFVEPATNDSTGGKVVSDSLSGITEGLMMSMTIGQTPIELVADNLQITLRNDLSIDLENSTLSPPATSAESQYGVLPLTLGFAGSTASVCAGDNKYVSLSIMKWGTNPYANSTDVLSPVLRLSTGGTTSSGTRSRVKSRNRRRILMPTGYVEETDTNDVALDAPQSPAFDLMDVNDTDTTVNFGYFITLQFGSPQNFNFSISPEEAANLPPTNFTFPDCTFQDGEQYRPCTGCNVSSYTNYNVTYICTDVSQICSQSSSASLSPLSFFNDHEHGRILQGDDDSVSGGQAMSMAQYGALFTAIKGVLLSTLSSNPFDINLEEAKVILSLVGSIVIVLVGGSVFFFTWDRWDKDQLIYSKQWPPKGISALWTEQGGKSEKKKGLLESFLDDDEKELESNIDDKTSTSLVPMVAIPVGSVAKSPKEGTNKKALKKIAKVEKENAMKFLDKLVSGTSTFFDAAFPDFIRESSWFTFLKIVICRHDYFTCFNHPSIANGRFLRWLSLWKSILIGLFVDTVFFSVFYSNDGSCELFESQQTCELGMNSVTNQPKCIWTPSDSGGSCSLREPPGDIMFTMSLALICVIMGVPIDMLFCYVLDEYASKRPQLEQIGLDPKYWLGTSTMNNIKTTEELNDDKAEVVGVSTLSVEFTNAEENWPVQTQSLLLAGEFSAMPAYNRHLTVQEELERIIKIVQAHFRQQGRIDPLASQLEDEIRRELYNGRADALRMFLGINADGSLKTLYPWEYLYYGSSAKKLLHKLQNIKKQQKLILDAVDSAGSLGPETQEIILLQYFILEHFYPFQKWVLRNQLFSFEAFSPEEIDALPWILSWVFVIGSLLFYVYWVLAWGVSSGNAMLRAWGINFAVGALQDIFFVQIAKLFIIYAVAIFTIRPQLQSIRMVLQSLTFSYMSGNLPPRKVYMYMMHAQELENQDAQGKLKAISSTVPRGSSVHSLMRGIQATAGNVSADKEEDINIFSSMATFRVVQSFSPACRAAWYDTCGSLGMAKLLKSLDDVDALYFLKVRRASIPLSAIAIAGIPFLLYTVFGDSIGDVMVDFFLPTVSAFFIVANAMLYQASVAAIIVIWVFVVAYVCWSKGLLGWAVRRVKEVERRVGGRRV
ncbi:hypothetical protein EON65_18580, partial [archaeon]